MAFGSRRAARVDLEFVAETGRATREVTEFDAVYNRTTARMSTSALRAQTAQEKLTRSINRYGPESTQAKDASIRFRRELDAIEREANQTSRAINRTDRELGQLVRGAGAGSGAFRGLGRALAFASGGYIGAAGLVYGIRKALDASSNLAEQTDFTTRVFQDSASVVTEWSNNALGLARDQALEAASGIGSLLVPLGVLPKDAAEASIALSKLGVDLASMKNTSPAEALEAIRSGLVGESEPLRRYAILLSEARVQQVALAASGKSSADELTNREKVLARIAIIQKDAALAEGNYAATINSTANQERERDRNLRNTAILIGETLEPAYNSLLHQLNDYLGDVENQRRIQEQVNRVVETGEDVIRGLAAAIDVVDGPIKGMVDALGGVENTVKLLVVGLIAFKGLRFASAFSGVASDLAGIGGAAATSAGQVGGLNRNLRNLRRIGAIAIPVTIALAILETDEYKAFKEESDDKLGPFGFLTDSLPDAVRGQIDRGRYLAEAFGLIDPEDPLLGPQGPIGADGRPYTGGPPPKPQAPPGLTGPLGSGRRGKPLKPAQQLALDLARAQAAGDERAQLAALRELEALRRRQIAVYERFLLRGEGDQKKIAAILENLYGDLGSARGQITSIEQGRTGRAQEAAARRKAARERAAAAREEEARERQKEIEAERRAEALELRNNVARQGRLRVAGGRAFRSDAVDALLDFYKRQAANMKLSREERERYRQLILAEKDREATALQKFRDEQQRKEEQARDLQLQILDNNLARAGLINNPERARAAEMKAQQAIIAYWRRRVAATKGLERAQAQGQLLAAQAAQKALRTKADGDTSSTTGTAAQLRDTFLADVQRIISAYAPNFTAAPAAASGKADTHLYELVHETRRTNEHLAEITASTRFPSSKLSQSERDASFV